MLNQKLFSITQVIAQAIFSFIYLSALIKSGNNIDYVDWSISVSIVSATYSLNIFKTRWVPHTSLQKSSSC